MAKSKDLFDDTTMSFGEHLEVLRYHMFKAIIGVVLGVILCLIFGRHLVAIVKAPIDDALESYWKEQLKQKPTETEKDPEENAGEKSPPLEKNQIVIEFRSADLRKQLDQSKKEKKKKEPDPPNPQNDESNETVRLVISSDVFRQFERIIESRGQLTTLTVEEAFMAYLKVSLIGGLILTSPWVFYQLWLFVAAGLYPHERHYVYVYMPVSLILFLTGVLFCFFGVFPLILNFLLSFNAWLGMQPDLRVSEWISFAVMLPLMFGLSFQLPLVMLFLEKISIFDVQTYREKRRISMLVIAVLSMLMTPSDPWSMLAMMVPLVLLYELGIQMCKWSPRKAPYADDEE